MAGVKTVESKAVLGAGMQIECQAGRHTVLIDQPKRVN